MPHRPILHQLFFSPQLDTSLHHETVDTQPVYRMVCMFTTQLLLALNSLHLQFSTPRIKEESKGSHKHHTSIAVTAHPSPGCR